MRNEIISHVLQTRAILDSMVRSYSAIGARWYVLILSRAVITSAALLSI